MSQLARPISDISLGGWSSPAWSNINEVVPDDDASYTEKIGLGTLEIGLGGVDDPGVGMGHIIRLRAKQQSGSKGPERLNCQLYEGGILVAETGVQTLTRGSHASFEYTLLEAEADSIGNYNDLRLKFVPDQGDTEVMRLTWAEVQVPDAAGEEHSGSSSISGNGSLSSTAQKGGKHSLLISGKGLLAAIGLVAMFGTASMSGGGSLTATGTKSEGEEHSGSASISGNGTLASSGLKAGEGIVGISQDGILNGDGNKQSHGDLVISGSGLISATGQSSEEEPPSDSEGSAIFLGMELEI